MTLALLADAAPTWTDKEVLYAVGTAIAAAVAAVVSIATIVIRSLTASSRERAVKAEAEVARLRRRLEDGEDSAEVQQIKARVASVEADNVRLRDDLTKAHGDIAHLKEQADGFRLASEGLAGERDALIVERDNVRTKLATERKRIIHAIDRDGLTWTDKVLKTQFVPFEPLAEGGRTTPVISVLNLKGGVGKTTTTAHLGGTLAQMGYRVLLIDLDLQGSLTEFYTTQTDLERLDRERKLLNDFLGKSFDAEFPDLRDFMHPIVPGTKSALVPTTDNLAYSELTLTVRWFLRDAVRDPRFLLRRELHLKRITNKFDLILLDCPPLLNTCCVNALAASDYVLVPVMPSKQSNDRVQILFDRLKQFQNNLNGDLKLMGFFANRTFGPTLTGDESTRLERLRVSCKDILDKADARFDTFIRQSATIRRAEDDERTLGPQDDIYESYLRLAKEVEARLPSFCRRSQNDSNPPAGGIA